MVELSRRAAHKTRDLVRERENRTQKHQGGADPFRIGSRLVLGQCQADIAAGSSGTVKVFSGERATTDKGSETESPREYTCYSRWSDFNAGDWCIITRLGGTGLEILPVGVESSGFPPGVTCDCSHCIEGVAMPASSTECCNSHPSWNYVDPKNIPRTVLWASDNSWVSIPITGESCEIEAENEGECTGLGGTWDSGESVCTHANVYRDKLTVDADAAGSVYERVLEEDNGCPVECFKYVAPDPFQCQCDNALRRAKFSGVSADDLPCWICMKPGSTSNSCPHCVTPDQRAVVTASGWSNDNGTGCSAANGTFSIGYNKTTTLNEGQTNCGWFGTFADNISCGGDIPIWKLSASIFRDVGVVVEGVVVGNLRVIISVVFHFDSSEFQEVVYSKTYNSSQCPDLSGPITLDYNAGGSTGGLCSGGDVCNPPSTVTVQFTAPGVPTSDGSCSGCSGGTVPEDPDEGSCCFNGQCFDFTSEAACGELGGTYYAVGAECVNFCGPSTGACCVTAESGPYSPSHCFDALEDECDASLLGGDEITSAVFHPDQLCAEVDCEAAVGGCCDPDPPYQAGCTAWWTQAACEAENGTWYEDDDTCDNECDLFGACCNAGTCIDGVTEDYCEGLPGTPNDWFQGQTCAEVGVCPGFGACCTTENACIEPSDQAECEGAGGTWFDGQTCAEVEPCAPATGACCWPDAMIFQCSCTDETETDCTNQGGTWGGAGTTCTTCSANCNPANYPSNCGSGFTCP